jgi:hypothetical protein
MHARLVPVLALFLSGCVAMTTSGTRESVLFTGGEEAPDERAQTVLKPYNDLPVSMEFKCPSKVSTLSPSYVVPLPPVFPAGFAHKKISYLSITVPEGMETALTQARIITRKGTEMPLAAARQASRRAGSEGTVVSTFTLDEACEALNGGTTRSRGLFLQQQKLPALPGATAVRRSDNGRNRLVAPCVVQRRPRRQRHAGSELANRRATGLSNACPASRPA